MSDKPCKHGFWLASIVAMRPSDVDGEMPEKISADVAFELPADVTRGGLFQALAEKLLELTSGKDSGDVSDGARRIGEQLMGAAEQVEAGGGEGGGT